MPLRICIFWLLFNGQALAAESLPQAIISPTPIAANHQHSILSHTYANWGWWLVAALILLGLSLLLWHPKLQNLGKLKLEGLILLQKSPLWSNQTFESGAEADFRNQLVQFQANYSPFKIQLELNPDSLKVEILTPRPIWVNRSGIPARLQEHIQILLESLPPEKYFIQTHLQGSITGLNRVQSFSLVNQERRIGMQISDQKRLQMKGIFFNG
jgi:hypothetical protein